MNQTQTDTAQEDRPIPEPIQDIVVKIFQDGGAFLAERLLYYASNEDLSEGDIPLTVPSAQAFHHFYTQTYALGETSITCSQDGCLVLEYHFPQRGEPDRRSATIWFTDDDNVVFAATDKDGFWLDQNRREDRSVSVDQAIAILVEGNLIQRREDPA